MTATSICPGPGGTRSKAASSIDSMSPGVRICRRIPSCSWSTTAGAPLLGAQRSWGSGGRYTTRRSARRSRPPPTPPAVAVPDCSASVSSSTSIWVACRCGCSVLDHPHQATQPGLLQVGQVVGQHGLGVPGHDIQAGRLARRSPAARGRCAPGAAHTPRPASAHCSSGSPFRGAGEDDHAVDVRRPARCDPQQFGVGLVVGVLRPGHGRALARRGAFNASVSLVASRSAASEVLISSHVPGVERSQPSGSVALLPFDGQQPLVQHAIAFARSRRRRCRVAAHARSAGRSRAHPAHRGRPRPGGGRLWSRGRSSNGRCGWGRRTRSRRTPSGNSRPPVPRPGATG